MKKLGVILLVATLTLALCIVPAISVSAADNGGADTFITGGGSLKDGSKPAFTFGGNVGITEDGDIVGQFQINDHAGKETWHCNGDFSLLEFTGNAIEGPTGPSADYSEAMFVGEFTSNRGNTETFRVMIVDVDEPGRGNDIVIVEYMDETVWFSAMPIDTGNFQMHGTESSENPNNGGVS